MAIRSFLLLWISVLLFGCHSQPNDPYSRLEREAASHEKILYSAFSQRPKHLDPALSYSEDETVFTGQIYEPPLQYHYLKRPYTLVNLTAQAFPHITYFNQKNEQLAENAPQDQIAYSLYTLRIKPHIFYQPHPAFVKENLNLSASTLGKIQTLYDIKKTATRELVAADYVYQIKRLADPKLQSPIFGMMRDQIFGFDTFAKKVSNHRKQFGPDVFTNLHQFDLEGARILDRYTYQIKIKGKSPQFQYWLAMPFFAPIPVEAEQFYHQKGLKEKNITLDWYPVGTGPYYLTENNPNHRLVLTKNPYFHAEYYPSDGEKEDNANGLLKDAGKKLPFIDKVVLTLEKENLSYWNKFLQGYYDASGISSETFAQAIQLNSLTKKSELSPFLQEKQIRLSQANTTTLSYLGFNFLDPMVGGEKNKKLRQAIAIAFDSEELIQIFANGRGVPAQGPIPLGLFGVRTGQEGMNPVVYTWNHQTQQPERKSLTVAKQLLKEAGYPNGIDPKTGKMLTFYFDTTGSGPDDKARLDWMRKQFAKLNIELVIRSTDYNRFQDKLQKGQVQIYQLGWNADYPDPENFLFLLYGGNAKVTKGGENACNYDNPRFNVLFEQMKNMENTPHRQKIIDEMIAIVREETPWIFIFYPVQYRLYHAWYSNIKPSQVINNQIKYLNLDIEKRRTLRYQWNQPHFLPIIIFVFLLGMMLGGARYFYSQREKRILLKRQ